jgi:hypothetical protein
MEIERGGSLTAFFLKADVKNHPSQMVRILLYYKPARNTNGSSKIKDF